MTCLAVIMMSICEMCINSKTHKKGKRKKIVDALIVHVFRLVGLTSSSDCLADVWAGSERQKRLMGQDLMKNNKGL